MINEELLYQLALSRVPQIGFVHARLLVQVFGSASAIFRAKKNELERIEGIGTVRAGSIKQFNDFDSGLKEIEFIKKYNIQPLFVTHVNFPQRLLNCYDAPPLLFYKGTADLNSSRVVAVVGTRSNTEYGKQFTEKLIKELPQVVIVSGLAYGIDAIAHKAAMKNGLKTIGVVGHGLDQMYPAEHTSLAKDMIKGGGGILTEFTSGTKPDKHNFPGRNRIVAGISDVTVVVETGVKGGSMITAELANSYNRDVFAVPGRTIDNKSSGCNHLIKTNKAVLLTEAVELIQMMGWEENSRPNKKPQKELFVDLDEIEIKIVSILKENGTMHIDELNLATGLSTSTVASSMLNLELKNVVQSLPGKIYKLI